MPYIKLCAENLKTRDGYQLRIGGTHRAKGPWRGLCKPGCIHSYRTGPMAALFAPLHGVDHYTHAVEIEGRVWADDGMKLGHRQIRVLREVPRPTLTRDQLVAIVIVCASRVYRGAKWLTWAAGWLSGHDRSPSKAVWAARAARAERVGVWAVPARVAGDAAAETAAVLATAEMARTPSLDIAAVCDLVLSTPESEWERLLEVGDE